MTGTEKDAEGTVSKTSKTAEKEWTKEEMDAAKPLPLPEIDENDLENDKAP